jgi:hypothetical protein
MKKVVAWVMLAGSATGSALSFAGIVGKNEPQLVLQLSWFALLFAAIDGLLIEHGD